MNTYLIEHKIVTLAENAVMEKDKKPATFTQNNIEFSHWDFNYRDGWLANQWLSQTNLQAENYKEAINIFRSELKKIIPRISLIGQSYIEFINQPFLIFNQKTDIALVRYIKERKPVGLMFMEEENKALEKLLDDKSVREEFYYYWNDAVNTIGYSSKLLLMFSAIESLTKNKDKKKHYQNIDNLLGETLREDLFGTKDDPNKGLRHRLIHGEYFNSEDATKNYLDIIHKKIIEYFNSRILKEKLIPEDVVEPQRSLFDNKEDSWFFAKSKSNNTTTLNLKDILKDVDDSIEKKPLEKFDIINIGEQIKTY